MIGNEAKSFGIEQIYILFTYPGNLPLPPLPTQLTLCALWSYNKERSKG